MRAFFAALTSSEIYQGCRTSSERSKFSESSSEPTLSPSASARESYEGLRSPDTSELSFRSADNERVVDGEYPSAADAGNIIADNERVVDGEYPSAADAGNIIADNERVVDVKLKGNSKDGFERFAARTFTLRELAAATKDFSADCLLGQGKFGRVYKGRLERSDQVVAIKRFNSGTESNRDFIVQVVMHNLLHHPNIVNFIGYCAKGTQLLIVHEFMPLGSLEDLLNGLSSDKNHLDWNIRMKIAVGTAKALEYIHDNLRFPVIFLGLKPSNILLGEGYHPKLSDLGLAKVAPVGDESTVQTRVIGTDGYCAPEYAMSGELSLKSDIYSFGVIFLEIITGRKATDNSEDAVEPSLVAWTQPFFKDKRKFQQMADPNLQGQYPVEGLRQALAVAAMCVQEQPTERPRIADVVTALNEITSLPYVPDVQSLV